MRRDSTELPISGAKFAPFGLRLREERTLLQIRLSDMADICQVSVQTIYSWERGNQVPNAVALSAMEEHGIDVLYVISGKRSKLSDAAEQALVRAWRDGSEHARAALVAIVRALELKAVEEDAPRAKLEAPQLMRD